MAQKKEREALNLRKQEAIVNVVQTLLDVNQPIVKAQQVTDAVQSSNNIEVTNKFVTKFMRKKLRMGYILAKQVPIQSNNERCLVLRQ